MSFHAFGPDHLAALAVLALLGATLGRAGPRMDSCFRMWMGRGIGVLLLGYVAAAYLRKGLTTGLRWEDSLPLNVCDWVLAACVIALFWRRPIAFEIAYFWGLTGTVQALLTPDVHEGFPSWRFFQFFWGHGGILLAIIWLIAAQRSRPRRGSVGRMFLAINGYALAVGLLNGLFGWNYGYLCHPPSQPSLLDHLGPWPWYLLSMEAFSFAGFFLLALPWRKVDDCGVG